MSEPEQPTPKVKETEDMTASQPLNESEMEQVAGGYAPTQEQYDKWEGMGAADRRDHGPGSGE